MADSPVVIEQFPGLDLRQDPGDSRGAIDLMNVTIEPGRVRTRYGSSVLFTPVGNPFFLQSFARAAGDHLIVGSTPNHLYVIDASGTAIGTTTIPSIFSTGASGVALGTPTGSFFYVAANGAARRWDGTVWTVPAGTFPANPAVVSLSPTDNRLVVCDTGSKVSFSDPGDPTTFGANNYVQLVPGDGEAIVGAAVFNNQTFVFKQTKFFVFYGDSTDSAGLPVFNYRTVSSGVGPLGSPNGAVPQSICTGPDGVYFVAADGVYRTTGGPPVRMSQAIDPFFTGSLSAFWQGGGPWAGANAYQRIVWVNAKMYLGLLVGGTVSALFVFDPLLDTWTNWGFVVGALTGFSRSSLAGTLPELTIGDVSSTGTVLRMDTSLTTDSGVSIVSRYRLPFENYGSPAQKKIRETIMEGTGTPTLKWSRDWASLLTGTAVQLGTSPAVGVGRQRTAVRGRAFSLQIGAASGAWAVNRIEPILQDARRPPGITV